MTARRFVRRAVLIDAPAPDIATVLAHLGYIQIDPINAGGSSLFLARCDAATRMLPQ